MSVIQEVAEPNLWDEICKEFARRKPPFYENDDEESLSTEYISYDPAQHNPVFYGKMFSGIENIDTDTVADFDAAVSHPSCLGFSFTSKPQPVPPPSPPRSPCKLSCTPTQYLNTYIYPTLLPALEAMLKQAKMEKCFEVMLSIHGLQSRLHGGRLASKLYMVKNENIIILKQILRRRTKFNACDYITEYLYNNNPNPKHAERPKLDLWDIPFVKEWLKEHPRPPLPKSLIWTDEEAALIIQSFWRGYLVRKEPDVQELRVWQREWGEENRGIQSRVSEFWDKQMPDGDETAAGAEDVVAE